MPKDIIFKEKPIKPAVDSSKRFDEIFTGHRDKISPEIDVSKYRLLRIGEILKEGDEFWFDGAWRPTALARGFESENMKVREYFWYRRLKKNDKK
jgi:hypothetical protein